MNIKTIKTMIFFVWMTSIVTAQSDTIKDIFAEQDKILKSSKNHPPYFYPEEFGEQLTDSTNQELVRRLSTSKDKLELRKIAQVLGDRALAGTLKLTDKETYIVEEKIRYYIRASRDFSGSDFLEVHDQILRFWDLAIYDLLRNLENSDSQISAFAFNIVVQMRNENLVRIMINKAKACKDIRIRQMYIGTLSLMTQQEDIGIINRQTMNEKDSQELFIRLIEPALKVLSPPSKPLSKN